MNLLLPIVILTANILGILNDPFEFEGDYGSDVNPIRQQVFDLVVSREALAKNLSDFEIKQKIGNINASEQEIRDYRFLLVSDAKNYEKTYGPTLGQLVTPQLLEEIRKKQNDYRTAGLTDADFAKIVSFIERYKDQKIFRFLRNNPSDLLGLDKSLRDAAAREGKIFSLPILGSTKLLEGKSSFELKKNLIDAVFTIEAFSLTKAQNDLHQYLRKLDDDYLKEFLGEAANNEDLNAFCSPLGQVFFYWMYHSLNLELISTPPEMISQVNKVKKLFAKTLGDPHARAQTFTNKLQASDTEVIFTQESDALIPQMLIRDGMFHSVDRQNFQDGTLILLRSDKWEPNYEVISIENYEGFKTGRLNLILATRKGSKQKFLLASGHGKSTTPEDGRLQIRLIMEKFHQLSDGNLQLFIGVDANTKTEEDVKLFKELLDTLGLISTETGPTTIKKRMVTAQHSKAGRFAIDEEDYLITLKAECGGQFRFSHVTVGFTEEKIDTNQPLPNQFNPSDHYPVGSIMVPDRPLVERCDPSFH